MKTINTLLLILVLALTPLAAVSEQPADSVAATPFPMQLMSALRDYEGTATPVLPKLDKRKEIPREYSTTPGRLHVPRQIIVNKDRCRLVMLNAFGDTLHTNQVCSSRNRGQKHVKDDCRTPEGTFPLYGVYNSTDWTYKDTGSKCYGPFFLSLKTPTYSGVGIHGTNAPGSIPGRSSHGCIRVLNENIVILKSLVNKDTRVTVLPDAGVREEGPDAKPAPKLRRDDAESAESEKKSSDGAESSEQTALASESTE